MPKLNYTIISRSQRVAGNTPIEVVKVEWAHADGPFRMTKLVPVSHPPDIQYEEVLDQMLDVLHDEISVPPGTPDHVVAMVCEAKREAIAKNLGIEP